MRSTRRRSYFTIAVLLTPAVAVACKAARINTRHGLDDAAPRCDSGANDTTSLAHAAWVEPSPSSGCSLTNTAESRLRDEVVDSRGIARSFELLVPQNYDGRMPMALTFVFHGAGSSASAAKGFGIQDTPGARSASLFVFPQGVEYLKQGIGWNSACDGYDMAFFDRVLAKLTGEYCIDTKRIFAAGFSWGCDFVVALNCCRGDRIRAIAAASCCDEFSNPKDFRTYAHAPCPARSAAAVRFTYDASPRGDGAYSKDQFAATLQLFREISACSETYCKMTPMPCVKFDGCVRPFVACGYAGLGHALPPTWPAETWKFFWDA
jgi:hypothetical protein